MKGVAFLLQTIMRVVLLLLLWCCGGFRMSAAWQLQQQQALTPAEAAVQVVKKSITGARNLEIYVVWPDPAQTRLVVLDNPDNADLLDHAMQQRGCLAGINGGYFQRNGQPLGLMVSDGRKLQGLHRSRLLTGMVAVQDDRLALLRVGEFSASNPLSQALQAGPFVIDQGEPVPGLHDTRWAQRSLVLADSAGRYGLALARTPVTLAELADVLATPGIVHEISLDRVLNLDGGSSSALWVNTNDAKLYLREGKRARNFLCVLPRR